MKIKEEAKDLTWDLMSL
ncbi:hypothetical protein RDABS01_031923 [Bienertia sinuspersici]